jgi:hypothetical protein
MRIPVKLLVFLSVAGLYYGFVLPKKAAYTHDLLKTFGGGPHSREDSTKALVEARIRAEICPQADLSEYRPMTWTDYADAGPGEASITHRFTCDAQERKFLFRLRSGVVTEIINLR